MTDILAPFRKPGSVPAARPEEQAESQAQTQQPTGYQAFGIAGGTAKPLRLDIRVARGLAVARPYSGISEIAYDREGYTGILLLWPGKLVTISGHNLRPVVEALLAGTCEFLAEFDDSGKWQPGAAIINKITTAGPKPAGKPEGAK
jgi:hypothetical protein